MKTITKLYLATAVNALFGFSVACSAPTAPAPGNTCATDSECGLDTVTVTDTVMIPTLARVAIHGYVTPLPDRRFCVYVAPIPADTTKRHWFCYLQADTTVHFSR